MCVVIAPLLVLAISLPCLLFTESGGACMRPESMHERGHVQRGERVLRLHLPAVLHGHKLRGRTNVHRVIVCKQWHLLHGNGCAHVHLSARGLGCALRKHQLLRILSVPEQRHMHTNSIFILLHLPAKLRRTDMRKQLLPLEPV